MEVGLERDDEWNGQKPRDPRHAGHQLHFLPLHGDHCGGQALQVPHRGHTPEPRPIFIGMKPLTFFAGKFLSVITSPVSSVTRPDSPSASSPWTLSSPPLHIGKVLRGKRIFSWKTAHRQLRDSWKTAERQLRDSWETAERQLRDSWETAERQLKDIWETAQRQLRDCWETVKRQPRYSM